MIWFNSKKAREHLLTHGEVVTIRKPRKTGHTVAQYKDELGRHRIGFVEVIYIDEVIDESVNKARIKNRMKYYYDKSGFDNVNEWVEELYRYYNRIPVHIQFYNVILDRRFPKGVNQ